MLSRVTQGCPLIRVQSWERGGSGAPEAVTRLLQLQWPVQAGVVATGRADVICIAPSDWLVVAADEREVADLDRGAGDRVVEALQQACRGSSFRAVEVSSALARVRIAGEHARGLLSKVCALDLGAAGLQPGWAPRTLVAGLPTIVRCLEWSVLECIVAASYAEPLWGWLEDAAVEYGLRGYGGLVQQRNPGHA